MLVRGRRELSFASIFFLVLTSTDCREDNPTPQHQELTCKNIKIMIKKDDIIVSYRTKIKFNKNMIIEININSRLRYSTH